METKDALLTAASRVVAALGSRGLTLEAVAREAGVSKGGLLYHFPTKKALIVGMVGQAVAAFDRLLSEAGGDRWLETYVEATLADLSGADSLAGILTAVAEDPELLAPFQAAVARWYARAEADFGPAAVPVLLALDGLWLHSRLGTLPEGALNRWAPALRALVRAVRP